jgi:hypothetical protein
MLKKFISSGKRKIILLTAVFFSLVVIGLGITPNYSCGCGGEFQNGTKLTYLVNQVSKSVVGKPVFNSR